LLIIHTQTKKVLYQTIHAKYGNVFRTKSSQLKKGLEEENVPSLDRPEHPYKNIAIIRQNQKEGSHNHDSHSSIFW
jgi:hypothetical protein